MSARRRPLRPPRPPFWPARRRHDSALAAFRFGFPFRESCANRRGMPRPRVFTIPASVPFLPTLVRALVDGGLVPGFPARDDPLALAAATLFLPNRRACRLARDLFLDALATDAAVLPRIVPIGGIDEEELAFAEASALAADALELPPALDGLERRLLLTRLVATWARSPTISGPPGAPLVAGTPAAALAL